MNNVTVDFELGIYLGQQTHKYTIFPKYLRTTNQKNVVNFVQNQHSATVGVGLVTVLAFSLNIFFYFNIQIYVFLIRIGRATKKNEPEDNN